MNPSSAGNTKPDHQTFRSRIQPESGTVKILFQEDRSEDKEKWRSDRKESLENNINNGSGWNIQKTHLPSKGSLIDTSYEDIKKLLDQNKNAPPLERILRNVKQCTSTTYVDILQKKGLRFVQIDRQCMNITRA